MDDSSILIIGANGQLGKALQTRYPGAVAVDSDKLDITNVDAIYHFDWSNVKTVINAAAYTNVDGAETPEGRILAWRINSVGAANLARVAIGRDIQIVHVSTDYVFDGQQAEHTEDEPFSPLGVYAQSKAAGDIAVSLASKHYILRTSWVIGDGPNFVRTMLELGQKGVAPTVVADQVGRLTFTSQLVNAIDHLLTKQAEFGTYNVSNGGQPASWADITRTIFKQAEYDLTVTDTTTSEYFAGKPGIAPRPLQSTLALDKLQATGFTPTDWRSDLENYIGNQHVN
ncbi:NAD(P)-dependent oxidoreductase [Candidatus Saccharibacteria bacterium CG_4_10_14_0_2_um_filter_52_9]|nr:MAG: NAD(P)-dependent oxidoreductase [Candidatus Saccharibacteria bacterium CG_4_10_14_0_2_um_filter_52_9]